MRLTEKIGNIPHLTALKNLAHAMDVTVYLVGGFLRDLFLSKKTKSFDFDFAVDRKVLPFAREFSKRIASSLVILDEEGRTYRVVLKKKDILYNYDFAKLRGDSLREDVMRRDFVLNTLCLRLNDWPEAKIIDYLGGRKDIQKNLIRLVNEPVLNDDPLRILRAFSIASRYGLKIDKSTRSLLVKHKRSLRKVAGERINEELFKILECANSYQTIKTMSQLRILDEIIPYISKARDVFQGAYHHLDVWLHSLDTLLRFESLYRRKFSHTENVMRYLQEPLARNRRRIQIIKLACLLHDVGKPVVKKAQGGKTIFHMHEKKGAQLVSHIAQLLKLSYKETESLKKLVFWHLRPGYLATTKYPSERAIYRFFRDTGDDGVGVILLSLADWRATRGPLTDTRRRYKHERVMVSLIERYFREQGKKPLIKVVNGFDIMKKFKLSPSSLIGEILNKIHEEQALGHVTNKKDAYLVAQRLIQKRSRRETR